MSVDLRLVEAAPQSLSLDHVDSMASERGIPHLGTYLFASNSRTRAERARKLFGYKPTAPGIFESMEADFKAALRD